MPLYGCIFLIQRIVQKVLACIFSLLTSLFRKCAARNQEFISQSHLCRERVNLIKWLSLIKSNSPSFLLFFYISFSYNYVLRHQLHLPIVLIKTQQQQHKIIIIDTITPIRNAVANIKLLFLSTGYNWQCVPSVLSLRASTSTDDSHESSIKCQYKE